MRFYRGPKSKNIPYRILNAGGEFEAHHCYIYDEAGTPMATLYLESISNNDTLNIGGILIDHIATRAHIEKLLPQESRILGEEILRGFARFAIKETPNVNNIKFNAIVNQGVSSYISLLQGMHALHPIPEGPSKDEYLRGSWKIR